MRKLILLTIITFFYSLHASIPCSLFAEDLKYRSDENNTDNIKILDYFISNSSRIGYTLPRSNQISQGEEIYFYYRVGPFLSIMDKGTPFRTRMILKNKGIIIRDFGWYMGNAASRSQMGSTLKLKWYQNARWNLKIPIIFEAGNYTVIISHHDLNSNKTLDIKYNFIVTERNGIIQKIIKNKIFSINDFIEAFKRNDLERCKLYIDKGVKTNIPIMSDIYKTNADYRKKCGKGCISHRSIFIRKKGKIVEMFS